MIKPRLYSDDFNTKNDGINVLLYVLDKILKLLHPIMPFITEEIYQHLPTKDEALIISKWPKYNEEFNFEEEFLKIEYTKDIIKSIRNIRAEMNIPNKKKTNTLYYTEDEFSKDAIESNAEHIKHLGNSESLKFVDKKEINPEDYTNLIIRKSEIFLPISELIDKEKELERLNKEKEKVLSEINRVDSKLKNEGFVNKAPKELIDKEKEKRETFLVMLDNLENQISKVTK